MQQEMREKDFHQWLSIRASAGSGKTFALTLRYIYLLFLGARASEILCITFTNKARDEMLERITTTLDSLARDSNNLANNPYANELIELGITPQAILTQSNAIYEHFITAKNHIMTFDAFFNMVVKKFSFYAGILSNYEVSANFDISSETFKNMLNSLSLADFRQLVQFCVSNDYNAKKVQKMIQNIKFDNVKIPHVVENPHFKDEAIANFEALRSHILQITECKKGKDVSYLKRRFLKEVDFSDIGVILDIINLTQNMQNALESLECGESLQKIEYIKLLFKNYFDTKESEILAQISSIYKFYEICKYNILKSKNKLNFEGIANICYDLLNHHIDKNFFYFRLDSKINHILVDEFQDTNLRQYEILKPLIDEIKSGEGRIGNRSLFFVGDEKQAIYGFRGCDSRIFRTISDELQMSITSLPKNYRSAKNIVEFVNNSFKAHFKDYESQKANNDKNGFVAITTSNDILSTIQDRIQTLLDNNKDDIAILTRKSSSAKDIYDFLRVAFPHIKISVESESSTNKDYLIILNFLQFIQSGNIFYLKNCEKLNGEAFSLTSEADFTQVQKKEISQMVLFAIKYFEIYSTTALQILESSVDFDDLGEFVEFLQSAEMKSSSDSKSTIQIMTIHKSKGLEFGDVIVCELSGSGRNSDIFYTKNFGSDRIYYLGNATFRNRRAFVDSEFADLCEAKKTQDKIDSLNLLYVAFTRAKESLFIIKSPKNDALNLKILDLEDMAMGADIVGKESKIAEIPNAEIPKQVDFGKQSEFLSEDSKGVLTKAKIKGLALHLALEMRLAYKMKKCDIKTILRDRFGLIMDLDDIEESLKNMENILQNDTIRNILDSADCVRCEASYLDNGLKRIDCVIECGEKAVILDYKSSDLNLEDKKAQVAEYVRYAKQHYKSVEGYLCFANGEILRV